MTFHGDDPPESAVFCRRLTKRDSTSVSLLTQITLKARINERNNLLMSIAIRFSGISLSLRPIGCSCALPFSRRAIRFPSFVSRYQRQSAINVPEHLFIKYINIHYVATLVLIPADCSRSLRFCHVALSDFHSVGCSTNPSKPTLALRVSFLFSIMLITLLSDSAP